MSGLEPITALTDAILAAWTAFLAGRLFSRDSRPVRLWAWAFVAAAVGSLAGVAYHGARTLFSPLTVDLVWKIVPVSTAVAALCFGSAAALVWLRPRARRIVIALLWIEFAACLVATAFSNEFLVAALDYVPVLIAILIGCLLRWSQPASRWIASGIVTSFVAVGIQLSPLRVGPLDHNDLFHLVQMAAMGLLYRGGRELGS